jgi:preprotein translocase subunit YajC
MQDFLSPSNPLLMMVAVAAIFYFLVMRPQQQAAKRLREAISNVRRGDTVVMSSGIIGRVAKVPQKDEPEITVEIADDVQVRVLRSALTEVRAKSLPVEAKTDKS